MYRKGKILTGMVIGLLITAGCSKAENVDHSEQSSDISTTQPERTDHGAITSPHTELPNQFSEGEYLINANTNEESYSLPVAEIIITVENAGNNTIAASESFQMEKLEGDVWYRVSFGELEFILEPVDIQPGVNFKQELPLELLENPLEEGTYRVVKDISIDQDYDEWFPIAAEFKITE